MGRIFWQFIGVLLLVGFVGTYFYGQLFSILAALGKGSNRRGKLAAVKAMTPGMGSRLRVIHPA